MNYIPDLKKYALTLFTAVTAVCLCASFAWAGNDFQEKYKAYQAEVNAGRAALDKKEFESAINHYSKAIGMSPFEAIQYFNRGIALYKSGKLKEAEEDFDKAIILDQRMVNAFAYRGLCREKLGKEKAAFEDYTRAVQQQPDDVSNQNNLAWLYATAKDEGVRDKLKALEHASKAVALSKGKNAGVLDTLARVYFINGQVKEAIEAENKALKLDPNNEGFKKKLKEYTGDSGRGNLFSDF